MPILDKNEYYSKNLDDADLSDRVLDGIEFDGCSFRSCNFSNAIFKRCNFVDCEFIKCNLSLVRIEYTKFTEVNFRESKLIGINWTKVAWPNLLFSSPIKFYQCILNDCSFFALELSELVFEECKAHNIDLRQGNFSKASFIYTDFTGSTFSGTNLSGADFSEATYYDIDIHNNIIKGAIFSRFEAIRLLESLDIELVD